MCLKRVEEEFDLVHNDFIKKLRESYPDLTNNEILMCAYLKLNLSTKEIAPLLNISVRGVETMRYRIRKKFNLEREENLNDFLSKRDEVLMMRIVIWLINGHIVDIGVLVTYVKIWDDVIKMFPALA